VYHRKEYFLRISCSRSDLLMLALSVATLSLAAGSRLIAQQHRYDTAHSSIQQHRYDTAHSSIQQHRYDAARSSTIVMGPKLYGSQQSRSPLVNWYAAEANIPIEMQPPRPSNHPFQQVPFLEDDGGVEVFESGAILLYLADAYGGASTPRERAAFTKWVVWSNSELDGLCFGAVPGDHRVRGTSMDRPDLKSVAVLNKILTDDEWLVGGEFSVADVAVGSYLNYVPIFFPSADLSGTPAICEYMQRCAQRPAFAKAFGEGHANLVADKPAGWLSSRAPTAAPGPADMLKKLLG
jgi:glutathione S-transferase